MGNLEKVTLQAKETNDIYNTFLATLSEQSRLDFRASFHIRPTSSGKSTVVSTLALAPMRGIQNVKNKDLPHLLSKLSDILSEIGSSDDSTMAKLKELGFKKRGSVSAREEDAQAAFVRNVILNNFGGFTFVATEFDLFEFGDKKMTKRPDVFVYRDGILYDIELKNSRNGPSRDKENIGYSAITQAASYIAHMKEPHNYASYINCISEFPNSSIGKIKDIRGVALVPAPKGKTKGTLEKAAKERDVELWTFDKEYTIAKNALE